MGMFVCHDSSLAIGMVMLVFLHHNGGDSQTRFFWLILKSIWGFYKIDVDMDHSVYFLFFNLTKL